MIFICKICRLVGRWICDSGKILFDSLVIRHGWVFVLNTFFSLFFSEEVIWISGAFFVLLFLFVDGLMKFSSHHEFVKKIDRLGWLVTLVFCFLSILTFPPFGSSRTAQWKVDFKYTYQKDDKEVLMNPEGFKITNYYDDSNAKASEDSFFGISLGWIQHTTCILLDGNFDAENEIHEKLKNVPLHVPFSVGSRDAKEEFLQFGERICLPDKVFFKDPVFQTTVDETRKQHLDFENANRELIQNNCQPDVENPNDCSLHGQIVLYKNTSIASVFQLGGAYLLAIGLAISFIQIFWLKVLLFYKKGLEAFK